MSWPCGHLTKPGGLILFPEGSTKNKVPIYNHPDQIFEIEQVQFGLVEKNLDVPKILAKFLIAVISSKFYIGLITYNSNE